MTDSAKTVEIPPTQVIIEGRLSYADIFRPRSFEKGDDANARYKTLILVPKNTERGKADFEALRKASAIAKKEKWGEKIPKIPSNMLCIKDGDGEYGKEETAGCWIVSASEDTPPQVLDRDGQTELSESDGKIYSGVVARVMLNLWCQDNKYGKRVNANLRAVQFVRHDEAFGKGRVDARAAFGSLEDDDVEGLGFGNVGEEESSGQDGMDLI